MQLLRLLDVFSPPQLLQILLLWLRPDLQGLRRSPSEPRARAHFALDFLTSRLPDSAQRAIARFNALMITAFATFVSWYSWKLALLNVSLTTPALSISLGWLYFSGVVGCAFIAFFAAGEIFSESPARSSHQTTTE